MKKLYLQLLTLLGTALAFAWALPARGIVDRAPAAIPRDLIQMQKPASAAFSPDLIASYNYVKSTQKPFDITQVVPLDLQPTDDSNSVFSKVADQSLSSIFNSPELRQTPFGQTATQVEEKVRQDVVMNQGGIQHKLTFQVQAFQSVARLDYKGYTNASLKYKASESSMALEVWEKITRTRDVILSHITKPDDRLSSVAMRWNF